MSARNYLRFFSALPVKDRLKAGLKSALLSKNAHQLTALKNIQAEIVNYEKSGAGNREKDTCMK